MQSAPHVSFQFASAGPRPPSQSAYCVCATNRCKLLFHYIMAAMDPKHRVRRTVGGGAAAQLASMNEEGPLFVGPQHFIAVTLDGLLPAAAAPNDVPVTLRMTEHVVSGCAIIDAVLLKSCYLWQMNPARLATFFQDADAAGISWDKVEATGLEMGVEELRQRFSKLELSYDQRVVRQADVTTPPPVVGYLGHISGSALVGSDTDPEVLFQLKALMTGHYNTASCTSLQSTDLQATLLASVGRDISHLPLVAQGALVVGMVRRTRQPKGYTIYPGDYGACLVEATRRAGSTQSESRDRGTSRDWVDVRARLVAARKGIAPSKMDKMVGHTLPNLLDVKVSSVDPVYG